MPMETPSKPSKGRKTMSVSLPGSEPKTMTTPVMSGEEGDNAQVVSHSDRFKKRTKKLEKSSRRSKKLAKSSSAASAGRGRENGKSSMVNPPPVNKGGRPKSLKHLTKGFVSLLEKGAADNRPLTFESASEDLNSSKKNLKKIADVLEGLGLIERMDDVKVSLRKNALKNMEKFDLLFQLTSNKQTANPNPTPTPSLDKNNVNSLRYAMDHYIVGVAAKELGAKKNELVLCDFYLYTTGNATENDQDKKAGKLRGCATIKIEKLYASSIAKDRFEQVRAKLISFNWDAIVHKSTTFLSKALPSIEWSSFHATLQPNDYKEVKGLYRKGQHALGSMEARLDILTQRATEEMMALLKHPQCWLTMEDLVETRATPDYRKAPATGSSVLMKLPVGAVVSIPSISSSIEPARERKPVDIPPLHRYQVHIHSSNGVDPVLIAGGEAAAYTAFKKEGERVQERSGFDIGKRNDKIGRFGGLLGVKVAAFLSGKLVSEQRKAESKTLMGLQTAGVGKRVFSEEDTIIEGKPLELIPLRVTRDMKDVFSSWTPKHRSGNAQPDPRLVEHGLSEDLIHDDANIRWIEYIDPTLHVPYYYDRRKGEVTWDVPPEDEDVLRMRTSKPIEAAPPVRGSPPVSLPSAQKKVKGRMKLKAKSKTQVQRYTRVPVSAANANVNAAAAKAPVTDSPLPKLTATAQGSGSPASGQPSVKKSTAKRGSLKRGRRGRTTSTKTKKQAVGDNTPVPSQNGPALPQQAQQGQQQYIAFPGQAQQQGMQQGQFQPAAGQVVYMQQNGQPMFIVPQQAQMYAAATAASRAAMLSGYSQNASDAAAKAAADAAARASMSSGGQPGTPGSIARTARKAAEGVDGGQGKGKKGVGGGRAVNKADAQDFLGVVRSTFKDKPTTYLEFLRILKSFHEGKVGAEKVVGDISKLFQGQPHLQSSFQKFIPGGRASQ